MLLVLLSARNTSLRIETILHEPGDSAAPGGAMSSSWSVYNPQRHA